MSRFGGRFGRSRRAAGLYARNQRSTVELPVSAPEARAQCTACSRVSVARSGSAGASTLSYWFGVQVPEKCFSRRGSACAAVRGRRGILDVVDDGVVLAH